MSSFEEGDEVEIVSTQNTEDYFGYSDKMPEVGETFTITGVINNSEVYGAKGYAWHTDDLEPASNKTEQITEDLSQMKPSHYSDHDTEPVDLIEEYDLNFNLGNVIKYVARHKEKSGLKDLKKARWYIEREIENREHE